MPDELPAPEGGAPEATQPDVDWQKRYTDTHAEYNRLNETLRRFESDPDSLVEFVEKHHPNLIAAVTDDEPEEQQDEEFEDEDSDDSAKLAKEVQELRQWQAKQEAAQRQQVFQQEWAGWEQHVKAQAKEQGIELTRRDVNALRVDSAGQESNGLVFPMAPGKATEVLKTYIGEYFTEPDEPKRPRAPHVPAGGKAQTGVPDFSQMSETDINKYMAERALALSQQQ